VGLAVRIAPGRIEQLDAIGLESDCGVARYQSRFVIPSNLFGANSARLLVSPLLMHIFLAKR
jgi:hypothetical protein